jgi:small GTP-binding protein
MVRQEKVCMIGATGVGKTSLVRRSVEGLFPEKYMTTIGVRIDRKFIEVGGGLDILLWDIEGHDEYSPLRTSYLRGATGLLVVADGTRRGTLAIALDLVERTREVCGAIPTVLVLNKADLTHLWEIRTSDLGAPRVAALSRCIASAKTGQGVEEAFGLLAQQLLEGEDR